MGAPARDELAEEATKERSRASQAGVEWPEADRSGVKEATKEQAHRRGSNGTRWMNQPEESSKEGNRPHRRGFEWLEAIGPATGVNEGRRASPTRVERHEVDEPRRRINEGRTGAQAPLEWHEGERTGRRINEGSTAARRRSNGTKWMHCPKHQPRKTPQKKLFHTGPGG